MITASFYRDQNVFAAEIDRLFRRGWQFVAMRDELAKNRDFVCVDLPGEAIVVQNFGGELRAFKNVCTHRWNRIQYEDRGNRPLMCRYHGWTFDREGQPRGVPERQNFVPDPTDRAHLCLRTYPVAACGKFVFVSLDEAPEPLDVYLGEFAGLLYDISAYLGAETHYGVIEHAANWKLLVENVLECYHCCFVHPETFVAGLGVGREPIRDVRYANGHSSSHFPRQPIKREGARRRLLAHLDDRPMKHDSFFHAHIFPRP